MPTAVESLSASALATPPEDGGCRVLEVLRRAMDARVALLAQRREGEAGPTVAFVDRAPAASAHGLDARTLVLAFDRDEPIEVAGAPGERVLAAGLDLGDEGRWCVAVVRRASHAWTARDKGTLAELTPVLRLAVANVLLRRRLDDEQRSRGASAKARDHLLSTMSHELRNPLAPILMWTSTLRRLRPDDPEVARAVDAVEHAVAIERRLLDDLSWVRRLEGGTLDLERRPIDLREVVTHEVGRHDADVARGRLRVATELPPDPVPVRVDAMRLARAIAAVLDNAIKFSPPDGTVRVRLAADGPTAELTITDEGPGIPSEMLPELFTPFARAHGARSGLGVGLAIARSLVVLHGGQIEARPGPTGGTSLVITLPPLATHECRAAHA